MSNGRIRVDYNLELEPLESLLAGVKRTDDFVTHGRIELPMPKVGVEGVGVLSFPVPAEQIAALIALAVRAPFGRGEETILDTSVRKVWRPCHGREVFGRGRARKESRLIGGRIFKGSISNLTRSAAASPYRRKSPPRASIASRTRCLLRQSEPEHRPLRAPAPRRPFSPRFSTARRATPGAHPCAARVPDKWRRKP